MGTEFEYLGHRIVIPDQEGRLPGSGPHTHGTAGADAQSTVSLSGSSPVIRHGDASAPGDPAAPIPSQSAAHGHPPHGDVHLHLHEHLYDEGMAAGQSTHDAAPQVATRAFRHAGHGDASTPGGTGAPATPQTAAHGGGNLHTHLHLHAHPYAEEGLTGAGPQTPAATPQAAGPLPGPAPALRHAGPHGPAPKPGAPPAEAPAGGEPAPVPAPAEPAPTSTVPGSAPGHTHGPRQLHLHLHRYGHPDGECCAECCPLGDTAGQPHVHPDQHVHLHLYPPVQEPAPGGGVPLPGDGHVHPPGECCPECCPFYDVPGHVHGADMIPGIPERIFSVFIDEAEFHVHQLPSGRFHIHQLPFELHRSLEDAARAIVDHMEHGVFHG